VHWWTFNVSLQLYMDGEFTRTELRRFKDSINNKNVSENVYCE